MTRICGRHGVSNMPNGQCYYCVLEGRAQEVQKEADETAKEEKGDEQVPTEHPTNTDPNRDSDSAPGANGDIASSASVNASGDVGDGAQSLATQSSEQVNS